jgi:hypothetical protein
MYSVLPPVAVDALPEVRLAVEEPHADERQTEIWMRLQVVARKHAETAAVDAVATRGSRTRPTGTPPAERVEEPRGSRPRYS